MSLHQLLLNSNLSYFILFVFRIFPCKISIKYDNRINLQTLNQFFRISIFEIYEEKHRKTRLTQKKLRIHFSRKFRQLTCYRK